MRAEASGEIVQAMHCREQCFISISNTNGGAANYVLGTDWVHSPNSNTKIEWVNGGNHPATNATYYVTMAPLGTVGPTSVTLSSGQIIFATAPTTNQAIFVEYIYTGSAGNYQTTNASDGGWDSILIDSTYTSRYLGKHLAMAYDWLYDYPGFTSAMKSQVEAMLVTWFNYEAANGYYYSASGGGPSIESNYGDGGYVSNILTAIALQNRNSIAAAMQTAMIDYHTSYVIPSFQTSFAGTGTLYGGYWVEGWGYGDLAIRNFLTAARAFNEAGWGSISAEQTWAGQVIEDILMQQPTQAIIYAGGDVYSFPLATPSNALFSELAYIASDTNMQAYANWAIQNYGNSADEADWGWEDLLFRNPSATASSWTGSLPTQYSSSGNGNTVIRKDWTYNSTWLDFQCGNRLTADHQDAQGIMSINRGADALVVPANAVGDDQTLQDKTTYGNLIVVDDGGTGTQNYRYAEGFWFGSPGVTTTNFDGATDYAYVRGDYHMAYELNTGTANSTSELNRSVLYVRDSDYIIVYDRATTVSASYLKRLQWNFVNSPTVNAGGNSWVEAVGSSKLFGQTFSPQSIMTAIATVTVGNATIYEVQTANSSVATVPFLTVLQSAPSTTGSMDTVTNISAPYLYGALISSSSQDTVVLFNNQANGGAITLPVSYAASPIQASTHFIAGLPASVSVSVSGGAGAINGTTSAQGVLEFTDTGIGNRTYTITSQGASPPVTPPTGLRLLQ